MSVAPQFWCACGSSRAPIPSSVDPLDGQCSECGIARPMSYFCDQATLLRLFNGAALAEIVGPGAGGVKVEAVLFNVATGEPLTAAQVAALEGADQANASVAKIITAERERCAKIADAWAGAAACDRCNDAETIAARIRSGE